MGKKKQQVSTKKNNRSAGVARRSSGEQNAGPVTSGKSHPRTTLAGDDGRGALDAEFAWMQRAEVELEFRSELKRRLAEIKETIHQRIKNPTERPNANLLVLLYSYYGLQWFPEYMSLDGAHVEEAERALQRVHEYLDDESNDRPLNILLLASPGSGKSQLVKSIAQSLKDSDTKVERVVFNMATMQSKEDLGRALDLARNIVVGRKTPLIFLDEFDSQETNYSLLLPLLWDGALDLQRGELQLGRCIFFLAGSRFTLPIKLANARDMVLSRITVADDSKLIDLFSRINGTVINVPSLEDPEQDRRADKIVLAMHMLRRRFKNCQWVPWRLLWFMAHVQFRYESRSIQTFINLIRVAGKRADEVETLEAGDVEQSLHLQNATRLKESPLAFHLIDGKGARGVVGLWEDAAEFDIRQQLQLPAGEPETGTELGVVRLATRFKAAMQH